MGSEIKIYHHKELENPSFFQRLLKAKLPQNFPIEVNNLLAKNKLLTVTHADISEIANRYGGNILKKSSQGLSEIYSEYLNYCLIDKALSHKELEELKHLKEILSLTDNDVADLHNIIVSSIYKKGLKDVLADGKIEKSEEDFLSKLQQDLQLTQELANNLSMQVRSQFVKEFFENSISDERLSPSEEEQFDLICKNLNIKPDFDDKIKSQLNRFKLYWVIENGDIPEMNITLSLENGEKCYFHANCEWHEKRTVTQRINYSGPTASIRIMKGVRYRVGSIKPQRITSEEWKQIDVGTFYLTNRRIIFIGQSKSLNIKLQKILSFTPYSDGIELLKDAGRSPLIKFTDNLDIFALILSRLLNE